MTRPSRDSTHSTKDKWLIAKEPTRTTMFGTPRDESFGIYLGNEAMSAIDDAIKAASARPISGLLLGFPLKSAQRPFLLVTNVFLSPESSYPLPEGTLFTGTAFDSMKRTVQKRETGEVIVGWFHGVSHRSDLDVTAYERYTHDRFFDASWHIALLIDTDRKTSCLYRREHDKMVRCSSFYFWNSTEEPAGGLIQRRNPALTYVQTSKPSRAGDDSVKRPYRRRFLVGLIVIFILFFVSSIPGSFLWIQNTRADRYAQLDERQKRLVSLQHETMHLQRLVAQAKQNVKDALTIALNDQNSATEPSDLPPETNDEPAATQTTAQPWDQKREYTIQDGDTMWSISDALLGDPFSFPTLAQENDIDDPDRIFPGQRLLLP